MADWVTEQYRWSLTFIWPEPRPKKCTTINLPVPEALFLNICTATATMPGHFQMGGGLNMRGYNNMVVTSEVKKTVEAYRYLIIWANQVYQVV